MNRVRNANHARRNQSARNVKNHKLRLCNNLPPSPPHPKPVNREAAVVAVVDVASANLALRASNARARKMWKPQRLKLRRLLKSPRLSP
jgi:hypothetical protein